MNPALFKLPGALPAHRVRITSDQWQQTAQRLCDAGASLLALWGSDERDRDAGFLVRAALLESQQVVVLELALPAEPPPLPGLTPVFSAAGRMERALCDLLGLRADGADVRPWLRHAAWAEDQFPLRRDFDPAQASTAGQPVSEDYPFVRVAGDGVHEIAVGPVHAGTIEPGHFRFSVVGEKVLRLEQRMGYAHKGIEKRFEQLRPTDGQRLAARVSGDSAVAFSWAYCMALEGICGVTPPARALWLRALYLERERLANHLGDLGALGNDTGFAFGLAQFSRLKEDLLRVNAAALGARYLMDAIVPGGVARDLTSASVPGLVAQAQALREQVASLREIYDEHAGVQDRFAACGVVTPALAKQLGLVGLAARASGLARDLRCNLPSAPYDQFAVQIAGHTNGDVAARVAVRFDEVLESLRLCELLLRDLPSGAFRQPLHAPATDGLGIGLIEGWRGPVFLALETAAEDRIRRCHPHDPSWQNWPVLEHAVIGSIVPDFPLINKSFNLSYSGADL